LPYPHILVEGEFFFKTTGASEMHIGAHMSAAGGVDKALERGKSIGIDVVQLFTKNQRQWAAPPLKAENVDSFRSQASSFYSIFSHSSYLINLASPE